jgi:hypothetical protein
VCTCVHSLCLMSLFLSPMKTRTPGAPHPQNYGDLQRETFSPEVDTSCAKLEGTA